MLIRRATVISAHFTSLLKTYASQPRIVKNLFKTCYFWTSRSFKVTDVGTEKLGKLVSTVSKQQICVCYRFHAISRQQQKSYILKGDLNLMPTYGGLLEPRGSKRIIMKTRLKHLLLIIASTTEWRAFRGYQHRWPWTPKTKRDIPRVISASYNRPTVDPVS